MSKRFLAVAVALAATLLVACGGDDSSDSSGGSDEGGTFTFVAYGGTTQDNVVDVFARPFTDERGMALVEDNVDFAKLGAMVKNGNVTWDAVNLEPWYSNASCKDGNAEPIDTSVIDVSKLPDNFHGECWMAGWSYSFVLAYRNDLETKPTGWADFYDTDKIPGKRGLWSFYQGGQLESALLADGVPGDDLYPLDVPRAIDKLDTIKSDVIFSDSLQEMVQQLVSGEVDMAILLSGRVANQIKRGEDLGIAWDQQLIAPDSYMVPKGAPKSAAAMELLNTMLDTEKLVDFAKVQFYGPAVKEAQDELADDPDCELINSCGEKLDDAVSISTEFWTDNEREVSTAWDKFLGR